MYVCIYINIFFSFEQAFPVACPPAGPRREAQRLRNKGGRGAPMERPKTPFADALYMCLLIYDVFFFPFSLYMRRGTKKRGERREVAGLPASAVFCLPGGRRV